MKRILWILALSALATGCSKKEDAPPPSYPHVAGSWSGNGTDDAIGYYTIQIDLSQSGSNASGTFTLAGSVATISGDVAIGMGPSGPGNLQAMDLTRKTWTVPDTTLANRVCQATMTVRPGSTFISSTSVAFHYTFSDCYGGTWTGGANLRKDAGTN